MIRFSIQKVYIYNRYVYHIHILKNECAEWNY